LQRWLQTIYGLTKLMQTSSTCSETTVLYVTLARFSVPQFAFQILATILQVISTVFIPQITHHIPQLFYMLPTPTKGHRTCFFTRQNLSH